MNWFGFMNWWGNGPFSGWDFRSVGNKNRYQGNGKGQSSWHNNYKSKKSAKIKAKNRAGKKARKANRRKK